MQINTVIQKIKILFQQIAPEAKVILYGSQARGDARKDSDIDLLILLPDTFEGKAFVDKKFLISDRMFDLSLECGIEISSLTTVNKVFYARKTPFTVNIANEGIVL